MSKLFLNIINMSISAGWAVLAVLLLRIILKKAPKWITLLLWGIVAVRLICPFSFESILSLLPSGETVSPNIMTAENPTIHTGISSLNSTVNPIISETLAPNPAESVNPLQIIVPVLTAVWLIGIAALLIYTAVSYIRLRKKVATAVLLRDNIYQSENVGSPFVLGIIKPKIYLPFNIKENDTVGVLAHEKAHIKRGDHLIKPFGFLLLSLHWFNPLLWLGYILLCRDIELACDQRVIKQLSVEERADYMDTLLGLSITRRSIAACPLAFGEVGVKQRVKGVLSYKKPAFWIIIISVILCICLAFCFLTDPIKKTYVEGVTTGSDREDISIEVVSLEYQNDELLLTIYWNNHSKERINYGLPFYIYKYEGENLVALEDNNIWNMPAFTVNPYSVYDKAFSNQNREATYNISRAFPIEPGGRYRFITNFSYASDGTKDYNVWVDFTIKNNAPPTSYEEKIPSNIIPAATTYKYTWEKDTAKLYLVPYDNTCSFSYSLLSSYWPQGTYTEDENRLVMTTYDGKTYTFIKENDCYIFDAANSSEVASYVYTLGQKPEICLPDGAVFKKDGATYTTAIDQAYFDIDGDRQKDAVVLGYGPTSGLFTFTISIDDEYFNIYHSPEFYNFSFTEIGGKLMLKGVTQGENPDTHYFDITLDGENIVLSRNGELIEYWGEQGINSPWR